MRTDLLAARAPLCTLVLIGGCVLGMRPSAAATFRVCLLANNPPYSVEASQDGFDVATGRAVARALKREFVAEWVQNEANPQEIEESNFPLQRLTHGKCDVIFSVPGPARDSLREAPKLSLGLPYYGAAFELIGPPGTPNRLQALRDRPVAIQAQTIASFALAILHARQQTYFAPLPALEGVANGDAVAGLLWGPVAGWQLARHPELKLQIADGYAPPAALSWNLHVATRAADSDLRAKVDESLRDLATSGQLARLARTQGFRMYAPFTTTYSLTEINKLH
ncbi:MAG: transporter substrate-binding domain-containing protein [Gammaproteobacteria bacterium]|nr:transporter substrate-binding domain-containing protein [Gammaproteobacteria bacterium]